MGEIPFFFGVVLMLLVVGLVLLSKSLFGVLVLVLVLVCKTVTFLRVFFYILLFFTLFFALLCVLFILITDIPSPLFVCVLTLHQSFFPPSHLLSGTGLRLSAATDALRSARAVASLRF